jgi:hypothetical protein
MPPDTHTDAKGAAPANSFVYRIDRLTGSLQLCGAQQCSVVQVRAAE